MSTHSKKTGIRTRHKNQTIFVPCQCGLDDCHQLIPAVGLNGHRRKYAQGHRDKAYTAGKFYSKDKPKDSSPGKRKNKSLIEPPPAPKLAILDSPMPKSCPKCSNTLMLKQENFLISPIDRGYERVFYCPICRLNGHSQLTSIKPQTDDHMKAVRQAVQERAWLPMGTR